MHIGQWLKQAIFHLQKTTATPQLDAQLLLAQVLHWPRSKLIAYPETLLSQQQKQAADEFLQRRLHGEPIAYILGQKEFWSLQLTVTPNTLIPRPETELLVEWILQHFQEQKCKILDVGTGSGAIALALAQAHSDWDLIGSDCSLAAIAVAQDNQQRLKISNVHWLVSDALSALQKKPDFDIIVSNPPYLTQKEWQNSPRDLHYEPRQALMAEDCGLAVLKTIIADAEMYLKPGGFLLLEHANTQAQIVKSLIQQTAMQFCEHLIDAQGWLRCTVASRR